MQFRTAKIASSLASRVFSPAFRRPLFPAASSCSPARQPPLFPSASSAELHAVAGWGVGFGLGGCYLLAMPFGPFEWFGVRSTGSRPLASARSIPIQQDQGAALGGTSSGYCGGRHWPRVAVRGEGLVFCGGGEALGLLLG